MTANCSDVSLYKTTEEIESLVREFESCALPRGDWTHRAHLTVALWYLLHHPLPEAIVLIREGIKRYNHAHGIATPTDDCHETLTLFWIRTVYRHLREATHDSCSPVTLANDIAARYGKNLPLRHYSRALLFSTEARSSWVEPDLRPLEEIEEGAPTQPEKFKIETTA